MLIYCCDWCQLTISLLNLSNHGSRSLYALGLRFRNEYIHTSTKQDPQLWKYGHVLFQKNRTRMWNWKLLYNRADRKKLIALVLMGFVLIATLCLKPWVAFTTSVPVKSCVPLSLKKIFNVVARRESSMHWDDTIYKRKATKFLKCGSANGGDCSKQPILLKKIQEDFPYRRSLGADHFLEEIKEGKIFGYVQCDIEVPENLRWKFVNFPPIFKNTLVRKNDIGTWWKTMPRKKDYCLNLEKRWYPSSHNKTEHLLLHCFCFICKCGLLLQKYNVLLSTLQEMLQQFGAVSSGRKKTRWQNQNSSVVAETMKPLANSSYSYQILDRSRHTITKYLTDKKTHAAINSKLFKKLDEVNN